MATANTDINQIFSSLERAALRHSDAVEACAAAFASTDLPDGVNWRWSTAAQEAFNNADGMEAYFAARDRFADAVAHLNLPMVAVGDQPTGSDSLRIAHREDFRRAGGIRACALATQAFIAAAKRDVETSWGKPMRKERRAANRALQQVMRHWMDALEYLGVEDALNAAYSIYRRVGSQYGGAEFISATGLRQALERGDIGLNPPSGRGMTEEDLRFYAQKVQESGIPTSQWGIAPAI